MRQVLHILTKSDDTLARAVITNQQQKGHANVEVLDLTQAMPDYKALVEKIFAADSIEVW